MTTIQSNVDSNQNKMLFGVTVLLYFIKILSGSCNYMFYDYMLEPILTITIMLHANLYKIYLLRLKLGSLITALKASWHLPTHFSVNQANHLHKGEQWTEI
jgi:hypothetical protein